MANIQKMLKQAQKMQRDMETVQNKLAEESLEFKANGVTVVVKCNMDLESILIEEGLVPDADDREMLQDVIVVAINNAMTEAREKMEGEMGKVTAGFNLPGMF
jgi:DNA-binding YbaB/EbfC family protein